VAENVRFSANVEGWGKGLNPLQNKFITLAAGGSSMDEAATAIGKSVRTLRRWKKQPGIAEAIRERTNEEMALARATLASAANRAARQLDKLASKAKPDAARISACRAVLENATALVEIEELENRLAELEARQPGGKGN